MGFVSQCTNQSHSFLQICKTYVFDVSHIATLISCSSMALQYLQLVDHFSLRNDFRREVGFRHGARYEVKVKINGNWLNDDRPGTYCGKSNKCIYQVNNTFFLSYLVPFNF